MSLATQFAGALECADHHDQTDFGFAHGEAVTPEPKPAVRAKGRAADWQRHLARAFLYVHGRAQTPEEAVELERLYEATLAEGPDFTHCRDKSEFKDAPELNLDRNAISKMMVTFYTMTRNGWAAKAKGKHRGLLSRCAEDVFKALVYLAGKFDRLFPSLKGLAYLARCCPASVSTALDQLEAFGIVTRHRRLEAGHDAARLQDGAEHQRLRNPPTQYGAGQACRGRVRGGKAHGYYRL